MYKGEKGEEKINILFIHVRMCIYICVYVYIVFSRIRIYFIFHLFHPALSNHISTQLIWVKNWMKKVKKVNFLLNNIGAVHESIGFLGFDGNRKFKILITMYSFYQFGNITISEGIRKLLPKF